MIYYVEDDINIRELALYALRQSGLEAQGFPDAETFRQACADRSPDLVLLDIMLPGENGLSILAWIRDASAVPDVPVMMLTAKGTEFDKVQGLDAGADDYLAKPFGMMELVSRCNALLRRAAKGPVREIPSGKVLTAGEISVSESAHQVHVAGVPVVLTLKEFDLLAMLISSPGRAFSRAQILESVWGVTFVGETRTVDAHVQTLRRKLNEARPGAGDAIQTIRGVGYRFSEGA